MTNRQRSCGLRKRLAVMIAVATAVAAAACSDGEASAPPVPEYPHGTDQLVFALRPTGIGGDYHERSYWLYGDRRVFVIEDTLGPVMGGSDYYAGPPFEIPPDRIRTAVIEPGLMELILADLKEGGLLEQQPPNLGIPRGNGGYYNVLVRAGGVRHEFTYLDTQWQDGPNLTSDQNDRRSQIKAIMTAIYFEVNEQSSNYNPDRVALIVRKAEEKITPDNSVVQDWPLQSLDQTKPWAGTENNGGKCMIVSAEQAKTVTDAFRNNDKPVAWRWQDDLYRVWPHPLLPDEKDCGSLHTYFILPPETS